MNRRPLLLSILFVFFTISCASQSQILLRDTPTLPKIVQDTFSNEGKSDYILINDEGYAFRLIYLCENRVYNFVEEPKNNHVLVSLQPILDTPVEKKLVSEERTRIWACMEEKVREEVRRVEDQVRRMNLEREQVEKAVSALRNEATAYSAEIQQKHLLLAEKQRRMEEEARKAEEERLRKSEEEQRRKSEEERKVKFYRSGEKDDSVQHSPVKATESGIFLALREANIFQEARENARIHNKANKFNIFEVINSKRDQSGFLWYQIVLKSNPVSQKGKRTGWSPEERSFWSKNKLQVWVYLGELSRIQTVKPVKLSLDEVQFTGKRIATPQKTYWYEVVFDIDTEPAGPVVGWVDGRTGIRRSDKTSDEVRALLRELSQTAWPAVIQTDILGGVIRPGFTPEQVSLAWGRPNHVNTTRTLVGIHEQWVYGESPFPNAYVYFENGFVKSWEFLKKTK